MLCGWMPVMMITNNMIIAIFMYVCMPNCLRRLTRQGSDRSGGCIDRRGLDPRLETVIISAGGAGKWRGCGRQPDDDDIRRGRKSKRGRGA